MTQAHPDTWLDRSWRAYINLRKMDLYREDKEPPGSDPAKVPQCHHRPGLSRSGFLP